MPWIHCCAFGNVSNVSILHPSKIFFFRCINTSSLRQRLIGRSIPEEEACPIRLSVHSVFCHFNLLYLLSYFFAIGIFWILCYFCISLPLESFGKYNCQFSCLILGEYLNLSFQVQVLTWLTFISWRERQRPVELTGKGMERPIWHMFS